MRIKKIKYYKIYLIIFVLIAFKFLPNYIINIYNYFIFNNKRLINSPTNILIDKYIYEENYIGIITYTIENPVKTNQIIDIINNKINFRQNNIYHYINKSNLLQVLITLNNDDNNKNYINLEKTIIKISKMNYKNIDEYFSVLNFYIELLQKEDMELDFLELIAENGIKIINDFIKNYYGIGEKNNLNSFVIDMYNNLYKYYLRILIKKYNIDNTKILNQNNLSESELKYFLAKKESEKYLNSSSEKAFLIPIGKIIGKGAFYFTISKLFKNKSLSKYTTMFGTADILTDSVALGKKINYSINADDIHKINRNRALDNTIDFNITDFIYNIYIYLKNIPIKLYNIINFFNKNINYIKYDMPNSIVINDGIKKIKNHNINIALANIKIKKYEEYDTKVQIFEKDILQKIESKRNEINKQIKNIKKNKISESFNNFILKISGNTIDGINYNYDKIINLLGNDLIKFEKDEKSKINKYKNELYNNFQNDIKKIENFSNFFSK